MSTNKGGYPCAGCGALTMEYKRSRPTKSDAITTVPWCSACRKNEKEELKLKKK